MKTITKYHKFLTAKTILAKKDGWKTLLPKHAAELMLDYESYGIDNVAAKLECDYGKDVARVIVDLAHTHVTHPEMNDVLFNSMLKVA